MRSISIFLVVLILGSACSHVDTYELYLREANEAREILVDAALHVDSIKDVSEKAGVLSFTLLSGATFCIRENMVPIVRVGLDGYWYLNGERTDVLCDGVSGDEMPYVVPKSERCTCMEYVLEGYTDWTFAFSNGAIVKLLKAGHSFDFDSIVRGVNHRGFCPLAPENTLPAYRLSRLQGFTYVETDIHFTKDGVPVCIHDSTVDRTSNGNGAVKEKTIDEIRQLDFGAWKGIEFEGTLIPTLDEFLQLCYSIGLAPYIELKDGTKEQIKSVVNLVNAYNLKECTTFISFSLSLLHYVLEVDSSARVGYLTGEVNDSIINAALNLRGLCEEVFINTCDWREEAAALCRDVSIPIEVWTVNSVAEILALPSYVSGVTSNGLHAGRVRSGK